MLTEGKHLAALTMTALVCCGIMGHHITTVNLNEAKARVTNEEARAILDRAGGKPLSEIIIEMRGPKV